MLRISSDLILSTLVTDPLDLNNPLVGYRNIVSVSTLLVSSEASGAPGINLANPATNLYWQAEDTDDQTITITNPDLTEIDYVGIAKHNARDAQSVIEIEGYTDLDTANDPIWEVLIAEHMPASNCPLMYRFEKEVYLGIRIHFKNNIVAPRASVVYCGELLVMQRRLFVGHAPLPLSRRTSIQTATSENGNYLGRVIISETRASKASFMNIEQDWYRQNIEPFAEVAQNTPFFWAWRPQSRPTEVGYVWLTGDIEVSNQLPNGFMQFSLNLQGIGCA